MAIWLFKSEPFKFSLEDLKNSPDQTTTWDGIRNYQARNLIRDEIKVGDTVLFYHSRCEPPGVVGIAEVTSEAYPDYTAWDPKSDYYDKKSKESAPTWLMVDVRYKKDLPQMVSLKQMKENPELEGLMVTRRGARLSIQPVSEAHYEIILKMGGLS